jgi:hypothetical protein
MTKFLNQGLLAEETQEESYLRPQYCDPDADEVYEVTQGTNPTQWLTGVSTRERVLQLGCLLEFSLGSQSKFGNRAVSRSTMGL